MVRSFPVIPVKLADDLPASIPPAARWVRPRLQSDESEIKSKDGDAECLSTVTAVREEQSQPHASC